MSEEFPDQLCPSGSWYDKSARDALEKAVKQKGLHVWARISVDSRGSGHRGRECRTLALEAAKSQNTSSRQAGHAICRNDGRFSTRCGGQWPIISNPFS